MMGIAPTVVLSRVPPDEEPRLAERGTKLAEALRAAGVPFTEVDSLYDLYDHDDGARFLQSVVGDLVVLAWHYPRATKWILARQNLEVNGRTRKVHCLDVREGDLAAIAARTAAILAGTESAEVIAKKTRNPEGANSGLSVQERAALAEKELAPPANADLSPRWYPVVDYDACTNCMECMDFCLFGVYGVDGAGTLRVTQQDQCRTDCPACARVCPVGAIIFPKYPTNPGIAGANEGDRGEIKLDLSRIFGKPKARHTAAMERDQELIKAGRKPVSAEKVDRLSDAIEKLEL